MAGWSNALLGRALGQPGNQTPFTRTQYLVDRSTGMTTLGRTPNLRPAVYSPLAWAAYQRFYTGTPTGGAAWASETDEEKAQRLRRQRDQAEEDAFDNWFDDIYIQIAIDELPYGSAYSVFQSDYLRGQTERYAGDLAAADRKAYEDDLAAGRTGDQMSIEGKRWASYLARENRRFSGDPYGQDDDEDDEDEAESQS